MGVRAGKYKLWAGARNQSQGLGSSKGLGARKYKYP